MGWQDRDYANTTSGGGGGWSSPYRRIRPGGFGGYSVVQILLGLNIAMFALVMITGGPLQPPSFAPASPIFDFCVMYSPSVMHGEIWRIITSTYLHWSFMHVLFNMMGLYFLGRSLEQHWGPKRFFVFYTIAGVLGNLLYLVLTLTGWLSMNGIAAGASGSVLGLLGACAVLYPTAQVFIFPIPFPIAIRTLAIVFGGWYVLNLFNRGANAGGDAAHLAGLAYGVWWAMRGLRWWSRVSWKLGSTFQRSHSTEGWGNRPSVTPSIFSQRASERKADQETIDAILRKVYEGGLHSLSESEKKALQEATARQQERERQAGRVDRL